MKIELIRNHTNTIPALAMLWQEVLGAIWLPKVSLEEAESWFYSSQNADSLPLTYVALKDSKPVGMCSLSINDGIRPDLFPWLGDLCVRPDHQQQGIGKKLIEIIKQKARDLHFGKLYLFTFEQRLADYYSRMGWQTIGTDVFKGHSVIVMEFIL